MPLAQVSAGYTLASGQTLSGSDTVGLAVSGSQAGLITIAGALQVNLAGNSAFQVSGVRSDGLFNDVKLVVEAGGSIRVNGGGSANGTHGLYDGGQGPDVTNRGLIEVTGDGAIGVTSFDSDVRFENTGTIVARGGSYARGVWLENSSAFVNSGTIEATASTPRAPDGVLYGSAAVRIGRFKTDIVNNGVIRADTAAEPASTAMEVSSGGRGFVLFNGGRLEGDTALFMSANLDQQIQRIVNTGEMVGDVKLFGGAFRLENSGAISGVVQMSISDDIYLGQSGVLVGSLRAGNGADSLSGGAPGEVMFGEDGNDTIASGAGADTVDGGAGDNILDGGVGVDALSFATSGAVTVDLQSGTATRANGQDRFSNFEVVVGGAQGDTLRGIAGATAFGGAGADTLAGVSGANYLRGDDGSDSITGGSGFDDINGNMGADTASGGLGEDWVVGGKDDDLLFGDAAYDLVYGNLGNDTCEGGDGADIIRGGQDNDVVRGGAGDDYVSGDRGDDTMTGGAGADIFHSFGEAGVDRVTDFSVAQGDRVQLDPGTQYTVAQSGADTVISMTGGGQMILVGVQMSSLPQGWIFGA